MRAVWLRTREGTRQILAEDRREGQYQDAADREERAVDTVSSLTEPAAGAALRGGKKLVQQAAQKRRSEKGGRAGCTNSRPGNGHRHSANDGCPGRFRRSERRGFTLL